MRPNGIVDDNNRFGKALEYAHLLFCTKLPLTFIDSNR